MTLTLRPLTDADADEVIAWRYPPPYEVYNLSPAGKAGLLEPRNAYFAVDDESGSLLGFCCFGSDARVPGGAYDESTGLDIGVGLRPDTTGQGMGPEVIRAAIAFAAETYGAHRFSATIAAFNERALRAASRRGIRDDEQIHPARIRPGVGPTRHRRPMSRVPTSASCSATAPTVRALQLCD